MTILCTKSDVCYTELSFLKVNAKNIQEKFWFQNVTFTLLFIHS